MKPDLIVSWPTHLDFPLFRERIHKDRNQLHRVTISFTNMQTAFPNYRPFIEKQLKDDKVIFVDPEPIISGKDWRHVAVTKALKEAAGDWVWFTEPDFTPLGDFWKEVQGLAERNEAFGYYQGDRMHPCCIFVKRELLDKTSQDFAAYPNKNYDHFGKLQHDLELRTNPGLIHQYLGEHMNGLSQNIYLLMVGQEPNYEPERFKEYCRECLKHEMPEELTKLFKDYIRRAA